MRMKKILIFELNWLGDILFSTPLIRALKKAVPDAHIACAVVPGYSVLLKGNPCVDSVIELSDRRTVRSFWEKLSFLRKIRKQRFDTCFFLKPSGTKAMLARAAGISRRIGFAGKNDALTHRVRLPEGNVHRVDQMMMLCGPAGIPFLRGRYEYFVSDEGRAKAAKLLARDGGGIGRVVIINPGGNWNAKRWPKERFAELAGRVLSRYPDVEVVVTGASGDIALGREISSAVDNRRCSSVAGETDIDTLAALFSLGTVIISADSGPLHLASASGARTIGLFGPTSEKITGPRGIGESVVIRHDVRCEVPCYKSACSRGYECMNLITVDEVMRLIERILSVEGI